MMNSYPVYSTLKSEYIRNYFLKSFGVVFIVLDIYNTYRPENETGFYYHIYNFCKIILSLPGLLWYRKR